VEREAFGAHRWRWKTKLLIGLADLSYTTGDYDQALRYVEEGLKEAQATSAQKYMALGWALRGKIVSKLGGIATAGTELHRAFTLADQLQNPSLIYPLAYDLGRWYEVSGKEPEAVSFYGKANATIEQMATLWRMRSCALLFCNRRWCKKFTNVLHGWAGSRPCGRCMRRVLRRDNTLWRKSLRLAATLRAVACPGGSSPQACVETVRLLEAGSVTDVTINAPSDVTGVQSLQRIIETRKALAAAGY
jgi:hypothetical protein